jgi:hypothetical protein
LASHRHTIENGGENTKKENVTHSSVRPPETGGNASNSAGSKDVMDADSAKTNSPYDANITRSEEEPIGAAPSVASVGAPLPGSGGGMPFVMTKAMKAALRGRGSTDADIERMTPGDAHKLIAGADEPGARLESEPREYQRTPVVRVPKGATRRRGIGDRV